MTLLSVSRTPTNCSLDTYQGVEPIDVHTQNTMVTDSQEMYLVDTRSNLVIFGQNFLTVFKDIAFIVEMIVELVKNFFRKKSEKTQFLSCSDQTAVNAFLQKQQDDKENLKIKNQVFVIPGLGDSNLWGPLLKASFTKEYPNDKTTNFCFIRNDHNGNQDYGITFNAIYNMISNYCIDHPNQPIALVGVSLGGRLCHDIEVQLSLEGKKNPVLVYAMASAFESGLATEVKEKHPCLKPILHPSLFERLKRGSEITKSLIEKSNRTRTRKTVINDVMASNDMLIEKANAIPYIANQGDLLVHKPKVCHGASHLGVIKGCFGDCSSELTNFFAS